MPLTENYKHKKDYFHGKTKCCFTLSKEEIMRTENNEEDAKGDENRESWKPTERNEKKRNHNNNYIIRFTISHWKLFFSRFV